MSDTNQKNFSTSPLRGFETSYAFFGTPDLVIPILDELERNSLLPSVIVTGKDVKKGRNMILTPPAPKVWAEQRGIEVLQPERLDEAFIQSFKDRGFDLGIVVAFGKIFPESLLSATKHGMLNVHYSLLPKYRGATPVESTILSGDTQAGVVIQKMALALDAGDILSEERTNILPTETAPDLRTRLNEIAMKMLPRVIEEVTNGTAIPKVQDDSEATYCKKIKKEDGLINLEDSGLTNYLKFRAYYGWPGTYFFVDHDGRKIRVKINDVAFSNGKFTILRVTPEGKKEMDYQDFLKGIK